LFVGEPKPLSFELLLENTILFDEDEIVDHRMLPAVKPSCQGITRRWKGCITFDIARTDYP
jgi:hypothetical protein